MTLDVRYDTYLREQVNRVNRAKDRLTAMFETSSALLALERGDANPAQHLLKEVNAFLPSTPTADLDSTNPDRVPYTSSTKFPEESRHNLPLTGGEYPFSKSSVRPHDRSRFLQTQCSELNEDQVWEYARSVITEALQNYIMAQGRVIGSVSEGIISSGSQVGTDAATSRIEY